MEYNTKYVAQYCYDILLSKHNNTLVTTMLPRECFGDLLLLRCDKHNKYSTIYLKQHQT